MNYSVSVRDRCGGGPQRWQREEVTGWGGWSGFFVADFFGDFAFSDVADGQYTIEVALAGCQPFKSQIAKNEFDADLGEIALKK